MNKNMAAVLCYSLGSEVRGAGGGVGMMTSFPAFFKYGLVIHLWYSDVYFFVSISEK